MHGILALAAYRTKKPVRWIYTREESFLATTKRHPSMIHYRTGAKKNGKLTAVDVDILLDSGAYASSGPAVATRAGIFAVGPYDIPHVRIRSRAVYTNHPIAGAMRGFGGPQVAFAHESQMDILAEKLGIDPYRLRKINCFKKGSETATGQVLKESVGMEKTLLGARKALGGRARFQKSISKPHEKSGIGYGCAFHGVGNTGVVNRSEVRMKLTEEGKVSIGVGASEIGQGLLTAFQQMAAEVLELSLDDIVIYNEDTFLTGDTEVTGGSKQTYMTGNAIFQGARNFIKEVSALLATHFKVSLESIVYSSGVFKVVKNGKVDKIRISEVMPFILEEKKTPFEVKGDFTSQTIPLNPVSGQGDPYPTYSYSTQIAEVKVDTRTGKVHVVRIISATDVGKAINPETIEGQIVGGAVMGFGYGVMEEYLPSQTKNLREYLIPTSCDAPRVLPIMVEDSVSSGPFGAKGIGEIVSVPTAAAIANAVTDAIGVRFFQVPITAERVSMALKGKKM